MSEQISYPNQTALDIRATFALAKVRRQSDLSGHSRMIHDALVDAIRLALREAGPAGAAPVCPLLFADEPELVDAWDAGLAEVTRCAANKAALAASAVQSPSDRVLCEEYGVWIYRAEDLPFPVAPEDAGKWIITTTADEFGDQVLALPSVATLEEGECLAVHSFKLRELFAREAIAQKRLPRVVYPAQSPAAAAIA